MYRLSHLKLTALLVTAALVSFIGTAWAAPQQMEWQPDRMTDRAISDKIEDELLFDPGVIALKIDVATADGIVTLTGDVDNVLAKERAARIAETVKGVRAVVNRVTVLPSGDVSDEQIERNVELALLRDPATSAYEITSTVNDGLLTLEGRVDSYQERDLAKIVGKSVRGVTGVDDQITIAYTSERSDPEIRNEIEEALHWNARVDDGMLAVDVTEGDVTLTGVVGSAAEKRLAEADAWVAGVDNVDMSGVSVEMWARDDKLRGDKYVVKSAEELRDAVTQAMRHDPRVREFDVFVDIDQTMLGQKVTLRGTVDNLKARRAAEQDARNTVGVHVVENRLKVRLTTPRTDSTVAEDVRDALRTSPDVDRNEITVTVVDGTAHLYGTVDSYYESTRADDAASRVRGVLSVDNHLQVETLSPYLYDPYVDQGYFDWTGWSPYSYTTPYTTDAQIELSVEHELWWSPFVDANDVDVAVDDGIVTLTGTVDSWSESRAATENAYEGGAILVDNDLEIDIESR